MNTIITVDFVDGTKAVWRVARWKLDNEANILWFIDRGAKVTINLANVKWWSREEQE